MHVHVCFPGYEQFRLWRSDITLCFKGLVGEAQPKPRKPKKVKPGSKTPSKGSDVNVDGESDEEDFLEGELDEGEDSEGGSSAPSTPQPSSLSLRK